MTLDPWGGAGVVGPPGLHDPWRELAAARALDRAHDAVTSALQRMAGADDVDWLGGPVERYRAELQDLVDGARAARARLEVAVRAAQDHAAAVRCQGALVLGAEPTWPPPPTRPPAPSWPPPSGGWAGGLGGHHDGLVPGHRRP